jgi:hypothetical protein
MGTAAHAGAKALGAGGDAGEADEGSFVAVLQVQIICRFFQEREIVHGHTLCIAGANAKYRCFLLNNCRY